mmetsp:Transcript_37044/g.82361  ORF Transcript_37044/g.82361 Transcript_37044/m.82361 type:complete len:223 (+) Transcript_37044:627-1295(+)
MSKITPHHDHQLSKTLFVAVDYIAPQGNRVLSSVTPAWSSSLSRRTVSFMVVMILIGSIVTILRLAAAEAATLATRKGSSLTFSPSDSLILSCMSLNTSSARLTSSSTCSASSLNLGNISTSLSFTSMMALNTTLPGPGSSFSTSSIHCRSWKSGRLTLRPRSKSKSPSLHLMLGEHLMALLASAPTFLTSVFLMDSNTTTRALAMVTSPLALREDLNSLNN